MSDISTSCWSPAITDVLTDWLLTRLGVMMELTPELFGRHTRDGTLLAQILHSYGIIGGEQLNIVVRTQDPALSRINLRNLRVWLRLVNVDPDDDCIKDVSKGKGVAALQLFYQVYLSLEGKDRLHFVALQKEQEKRVRDYGRFDVTKVREGDSPDRPAAEHRFAKPLIEAADTVLWHREKFQRIVEACGRERERLAVDAEHPAMRPFERVAPTSRTDEKARMESRELDDFAGDDGATGTKEGRRGPAECCPGKRSLRRSFVEDPAVAVKYVDSLRKRRTRATECGESKLRTQARVAAMAWEGLMRKQDRSVDEALARRVLDQSRYEKKIMRRLCEVRQQKNRIVENCRLLDGMLVKVTEDERRLEQDRRRDAMRDDKEAIETESCRMRELRKRIREWKLRRLRERHFDIVAEVVRDIADIATKAARYRRANDNHVPPSVWCEWRTLFLKCQPIFGLADHRNGDAQDEGRGKDARTDDGEIGEDEDRRVLADADLEGYLELASPWREFAPAREREADEVCRLGGVVLGRVVRRLLAFSYPPAAETATWPMPSAKIAAVVVGIRSATLHERLRELLRARGVHLVRMEDAINHCLQGYKREMSDVEYIDLNIVTATARELGRTPTEAHESRDTRATKTEKGMPTRARRTDADEKQTQTPRQIPYDDMDPILSNAACIGKWTYEFLTLGQPISNELNTRILTEYLRSLGHVEGWTLINYPDTYAQMALLETALTGREVPGDRGPTDWTSVNVEDIDSPSPRIVFETKEADPSAAFRRSRLFPDPIGQREDQRHTATTFVTMYIRAMPKTSDGWDDGFNRDKTVDEAAAMDRYYADRNVAYGFYYDTLDSPVLRQLAELIAADVSGLISRTNGDERERASDSKAAVIEHWSAGCERRRGKGESVEVGENLRSNDETQHGDHAARPGEENWRWTEMPRCSSLLESLAGFWESAEGAYAENVKEALLLKRIHASAIVPYKDLVVRDLEGLLARPDQRQHLLREFQRAFNQLDDDVREDPGAKCELHCRVSDFRSTLWQLCDTRRRDAEEERRRVARNRWISVEAAVLVNVYISILQAEVDRFVDTMQLLRDYYSATVRKAAPHESRFAKIVLDRVELKDDPAEASGHRVDPSSATNDEPTTSRMKPADEEANVEPRANSLERFGIELEELLTNPCKDFQPDRNIVYDRIADNVARAQSAVDSIWCTVTEMMKREEKLAAPKREEKLAASKPRMKSETTGPTVSAIAGSEERVHDLVQEWRYAASFEMDRVRRMLHVLSAAARSDVTFLLDTIRLAFHRLHDRIVERYKGEIQSVDDVANVFCLAVERARPIEQELLLDGDRLVVGSEDTVESSTSTSTSTEVPSPLRFRMDQLHRLLDVFLRIAPAGIISERGLVYVLQDLVSCGDDECYPPSVPCAWRRLRSSDIEVLVGRLLGSAEYTEWRQFMVYAMDLPVPSHRDILKARLAFRNHDPELKETVTRERYSSVPLWFLEDARNTLDTADDEEPWTDHESVYTGDTDADDGGIADRFNDLSRKRPSPGTEAPSSGFVEAVAGHDSGMALRSRLAQELLCRMYLVDERAVNYTALLLAFCKDADPREGLGKAFSLAMGAKVCSDLTEGERYVEELVGKRAAEKMRPNRDDLEAARQILRCVMDRVTVAVSVLEAERSNETGLAPRRRIIIEKLNGSGEIDPADLLPADVATSERLVAEDWSMIDDASGREYSSVSTVAMALADYAETPLDERTIYWLPRNVCSTVLSAGSPCQPTATTDPPRMTKLEEGIARVYAELRDETLSDEEDTVLAHRLINHDFIRRLLSASARFAWRDMTSILRAVLKNANHQL